MATPLGTTFVTDEQVVAQGDVLYKGKTVESLVVEFDQAKYGSSSLPAPRAQKPAPTAGSLRGLAPKSALSLSQRQLL